MVLQKTELIRLQLFVKLCYKLASKFRKAEGKLKIKNPNLQNKWPLLFYWNTENPWKWVPLFILNFEVIVWLFVLSSFFSPTVKHNALLHLKVDSFKNYFDRCFIFFFVISCVFPSFFFNSLTFLWKTFFFPVGNCIVCLIFELLIRASINHWAINDQN